MWSKNGTSRTDAKVNEVMDKLFHERFCDKGTCQGCNKNEALGIFGPDGHDKFYCRTCWKKYLRDGASEEEWQDWTKWKPSERVCPSENSYQCEVKCMLLALSRLGGSITFPSSLSAYDRMKVHEFCNKEPELQRLFKKSYGEGDERFLRVSSFDFKDGLQEAKAIVQAEEEQAEIKAAAPPPAASAAASAPSPPPPPPPPPTAEQAASGDDEVAAAESNGKTEEKKATKEEQKERRTQKNQAPCSSTEEKTATKKEQKEEKPSTKHDQNDQSKQAVQEELTKDEFPSLSSGLGQGAGKKKKGRK